MWIFLSGAMLSIVDQRAKGSGLRNRSPGPDDMLVVRARVRGDIQRVFWQVKVIEDEKTDYRFRALVPRWKVSEMLADQVRSLDYGNFKGSVPDDERHDVYQEVWAIHHRWQLRLMSAEPKGGSFDTRPRGPGRGAAGPSRAGQPALALGRPRGQSSPAKPRGQGPKKPRGA